jgi:hypothetical protein
MLCRMAFALFGIEINGKECSASSGRCTQIVNDETLTLVLSNGVFL